MESIAQCEDQGEEEKKSLGEFSCKPAEDNPYLRQTRCQFRSVV
jgi:hypothetical protein